MNTLKVTNKYLAFNGTEEEAYSLVAEIRDAYNTAGNDMGKTLNDFVLSLEVALQETGYLDENFEPTN